MDSARDLENEGDRQQRASGRPLTAPTSASLAGQGPPACCWVSAAVRVARLPGTGIPRERESPPATQSHSFPLSGCDGVGSTGHHALSRTAHIWKPPTPAPHTASPQRAAGLTLAALPLHLRAFSLPDTEQLLLTYAASRSAWDSGWAPKPTPNHSFTKARCLARC